MIADDHRRGAQMGAPQIGLLQNGTPDGFFPDQHPDVGCGKKFLEKNEIFLNEKKNAKKRKKAKQQKN